MTPPPNLLHRHGRTVVTGSIAGHFALIFGFLTMLLAAGCGPREQVNRVTPGFLQRNGFAEVIGEPQHYILAHIKLKDAAARLGFSPLHLPHGTNCPPNSDIRSAIIRDYEMAVISETLDSHGMIRPDSLDDPESLCAVHVWLYPQLRRDSNYGDMLFTNKATGDAGQFILQRALALGAHPLATNGLPVLQGPYRYHEDQGYVAIRLPGNQSALVESFLRQAFGPPTEMLVKSTIQPLQFHGAVVTNFSIVFDHYSDFAQVQIRPQRPLILSDEPSESSGNPK